MTGKPKREVLFEFYSVGMYTKCSAICPVTGVEVSIVGPADMPERVLMNNARRKLDSVLERGQSAQEQRGRLV